MGGVVQVACQVFLVREACVSVLVGGARMEVFDELLSINVPWSEELSDVLRIWT